MLWIIFPPMKKIRTLKIGKHEMWIFPFNCRSESSWNISFHKFLKSLLEYKADIGKNGIFSIISLCILPVACFGCTTNIMSFIMNQWTLSIQYLRRIRKLIEKKDQNDLILATIVYIIWNNWIIAYTLIHSGSVLEVSGHCKVCLLRHH